MLTRDKLMLGVMLLIFGFGAAGIVWRDEPAVTAFVGSIPPMLVGALAMLGLVVRFRFLDRRSKARSSWGVILVGAGMLVAFGYAGVLRQSKEAQQADLLTGFAWLLAVPLVFLLLMDELRRRRDSKPPGPRGDTF